MLAFSFERCTDYSFSNFFLQEPPTIGNIMCSVCTDNFPQEKLMGLTCGHLFCQPCWDMHFRIQIVNGRTMGEFQIFHKWVFIIYGFEHLFQTCLAAWLISNSSPFKTVAEEEIVSVCWRYVQIFLAKIRKNNAGMRRTRLGKNNEFFRKLWLVK